MLFFLFPHKVDQSGLELYLIKPLKAFLDTFEYRLRRPLGQGKFGQNKTNETQDSPCLILANKTVQCLIELPAASQPRCRRPSYQDSRRCMAVLFNCFEDQYRE